MNAATEDSELGMEDSGSAIDPSVPSDDEDDCEFDMGASYKPIYAANSHKAGHNTRGAARQLRQQQAPASPVTPPLRTTSLGPQQRQRQQQQQQQQQPSPPGRLDLGGGPNSHDAGHNTRGAGGQQRQQGTPELPVTDRLPTTSREAQQQQQQQQPSPPDPSPANPAVCVAIISRGARRGEKCGNKVGGRTQGFCKHHDGLQKRRKTASGAALGVGGSVEAGNYDSESELGGGVDELQTPGAHPFIAKSKELHYAQASKIEDEGFRRAQESVWHLKRIKLPKPKVRNICSA